MMYVTLILFIAFTSALPNRNAYVLPEFRGNDHKYIVFQGFTSSDAQCRKFYQAYFQILRGRKLDLDEVPVEAADAVYAKANAPFHCRHDCRELRTPAEVEVDKLIERQKPLKKKMFIDQGQVHQKGTFKLLCPPGTERDIHESFSLRRLPFDPVDARLFKSTMKCYCKQAGMYPVVEPYRDSAVESVKVEEQTASTSMCFDLIEEPWIGGSMEEIYADLDGLYTELNPNDTDWSSIPP